MHTGVVWIRNTTRRINVFLITNISAYILSDVSNDVLVSASHYKWLISIFLIKN